MINILRIQFFKPVKNSLFDIVLKLNGEKNRSSDYFTLAINVFSLFFLVGFFGVLIGFFIKKSFFTFFLVCIFAGGIMFYVIYFEKYFSSLFKVKTDLIYSSLIVGEIVSNLEFFDSLERSVLEVRGFSNNLFLNKLKQSVRLSERKGVFLEFFKKDLLFFSRINPSLKKLVFSFGLAFSEVSKKSRIDFLKRGVKELLDDLVLSIDEFNSKLQFPLLIIFSVGTVLPLILFSILPLFFLSSGFSVFLKTFFGLLFMLMLTYFYSNYVLSSRPLLPIFSSYQRIDFKKKYFVYVISLSFFIVVLLLFFFLTEFDLIFFSFLKIKEMWLVMGSVLFLSFGLIFGSFFHFLSKDSVNVLKSQEVFNNYLSDLMGFISVGLANGLSFERVIFDVKSIDSPFKKFFLKVESLLKKGRSVRKSFGIIFCPPLFSGFIFDFFVFLGKASEYNTLILSRVLFSTSDFFSRVMKIHKSFVNKISNITTMLRFTLLVIAPLILSFSIVLSKVLFASFTSFDFSFFGVSVFANNDFNFLILLFFSYFYLILFGIIITRFYSYLLYGFNKAYWFRELSIFLPITSFIYSFSLLFSSKLFGVF